MIFESNLLDKLEDQGLVRKRLEQVISKYSFLNKDIIKRFLIIKLSMAINIAY